MQVFDIALVLHIFAGTLCVITGAITLFAPKRRGAHTDWGEIYHAYYVVLFLTSVAMAILHWSESGYLFYIAIFSYGLALVGYLARKIRWNRWLSTHISGMCGSYIGAITAVLVVNGPKLPLLNQLPVALLWFLPSMVGSPLIAWTVASRMRHARNDEVVR